MTVPAAVRGEAAGDSPGVEAAALDGERGAGHDENVAPGAEPAAEAAAAPPAGGAAGLGVDDDGAAAPAAATRTAGGAPKPPVAAARPWYQSGLTRRRRAASDAADTARADAAATRTDIPRGGALGACAAHSAAAPAAGRRVAMEDHIMEGDLPRAAPPAESCATKRPPPSPAPPPPK